MLTITIIEPPADCRYMTLAETIRSNGERHQANGDRYMEAGNPDYAAGSYLKAKRNFDRAAKLNRGLFGAATDQDTSK